MIDDRTTGDRPSDEELIAIIVAGLDTYFEENVVICPEDIAVVIVAALKAMGASR